MTLLHFTSILQFNSTFYTSSTQVIAKNIGLNKWIYVISSNLYVNK